ncbi:CRISPR-associated endonuclease Cas2 [Pyruvatibacter mobilis]|uniref:CRISPR-associated endonuclease Cas2 n=1 Tax=Pyruvatibacter mobilis TaxID=1712261 RepID=UPI003BB00BF0
MARPRHLYVFCYDIEKNADRVRVSGILDNQLVRVQQSVFEGRLTREAAWTLAERSKVAMGPEDNLRVYCLTESGRKLSMAFGGAPIPEADEFWIV